MTLLLRALRGEPTPRRPLWILRQAGRYLPEYRALRAEVPFEQLLADPALAAEVTLQPLRRFRLDAAIVFADLMSPLAGLGIDVRFAPGPVLAEPVATRGRIEALRVPPAAEIAPSVYETLRQVRRGLPPGTPLLGFAGAPLSLAAYLIEGRGTKEFLGVRRLLAEDTAAFGLLLARLAELTAAYLREQVAAGADAVQIFDSWAGILPAADWRAHVRPHLLDLLDAAGHAGVPRILFCHGAPHLWRDYAALPAEALAVCWRADLAALRRELGPERPVQGNLDPAVLLAGPDATRRAAAALLAAVPARGHVVNLGHGILPDTPLDSVAALVECVHGERNS
jgi:uroporphyrinogen decarboxylase